MSAAFDPAPTRPAPDPVALLNAWLAVEALQPQCFNNQEALLRDDDASSDRPQKGRKTPKSPARAQFPFDLNQLLMPWEQPEGDRRQLCVDPDDALVWYVPLGFVKMEPATARLVATVEQEGPERERASGVAVLALAAFDEHGRALPSRFLLSSFGWACGQVLAGRIDHLHQFVDVETDLRHSLGQTLVEQDVDGRTIATSRKRFLAAMTAIMQTLGLPVDLLERPRVAIRVIGQAESDPLEVINSFYLRDLHAARVALEAGGGGATLAAYLGQTPPSRRDDVLADKAVLEALVAPGLTPPARWPAPRPARLVTLQQAAVNGAMRDLAEGGLLSINGPPGTGKTTLLRDVIAAVLGQRKHRSDFVEAAWWHPQWGLEKYLRVAAGADLPMPLPEIIGAEQPPRTPAEGRERWRRALLDYREKRAIVARMQAHREQIRWALGAGAGVRQAADDAQAARLAARADRDAAERTRRAAVDSLARAETGVADARRLVDNGAALRPGLLARLLGGDAAWRETQGRAVALLSQALADQGLARAEAEAAEQRRDQAALDDERARNAAVEAQEQLALLLTLEAEGQAMGQDTLAGPAFWQGDHAALHIASPWADAEWTAARDALFTAALALHRAFLDAAAKPMKANLGLIMDHLKGRPVPSGAAEHLAELWDSLFLVVPLVSTTFASFHRMMGDLNENTLGWLIVDESGQATPQAAVGAIHRARRALVIGDPLQIEPISTAPQGLVRAIFASRGAHPDLWAAPRASAQVLADAASPLTAGMGSGVDARRIGMPLLVHRRCQEPMFGIANTIAYDGLMVHQAGPARSAVKAALADLSPGSFWLDVDAGAAKWSPDEGKAVLALLERLADQGVVQPDLYMIAPFRDVADRLRRLVVGHGVLTRLGIAPRDQKAWGAQRIGTVHTFQGKEAEAVFLVLGAGADASRGSRDWAGGSPNILNVAMTRAKQAIYVIGRHEAWRQAGVFAVAAETLPVVSLPHPSDA